MSNISKSPKGLLLLSAIIVAVPGSLAAQQETPPDADLTATVYGAPADEVIELAEGPEIDGVISARRGDQIQVTSEDGANTIIAINDETQIRGKGGFLGLARDQLAEDALLNGIPVSVETLQSGGGLLASKIALKNKDLKTASMIHMATAQGFEEQTAATDALRGRVGDIDQYNIKNTTNVNFDIGKANLSPQAQQELCATAAAAESMDNALLLVVGYTDSTGSLEFNQELSEKRASRVVNHLQQVCGWKPYRMLTPTGMAVADPLANNDTEMGRQQNRRVAVNVMVSKAVDGL